MSNQFLSMNNQFAEMMAFLRQSLEDNKSQINVVEKKQQEATDEQREHLVLLRENRTVTELYRVEAQGANRNEIRKDLRSE